MILSEVATIYQEAPIVLFGWTEIITPLLAMCGKY